LRKIVTVVANAMRDRIESGHDRTVRWKRQGSRTIDASEADPFPGQAVEMGRPSLRIAITAQMVGSGRIERYEQDGIDGGVPRTGTHASRPYQKYISQKA
jgi:hypothetical protein